MEKQIDYAILRAYNNKAYDPKNPPDVANLISKIDPVVKKIIVVVNGPQDGANTPEFLRSTFPTQSKEGKIETIVLENYGWSKALNEGLRASMPKSDYETRLMISNEVNPTQEQLMEMHEKVLKGNAISSVVYGLFNTGSYALFEGRDEPTCLVPRNTCTLWRSDVMKGFAFNEKLDSQMGMEDVYMGLQIYAKTKLLPVLGPTNVKWAVRQGVNSQEKHNKERETIRNYLPQFRDDTLNAYFNALSVIALSKGKGNGMPLFRAIKSYE
ncbi:hypothetical protein HY449_02530 [Candidatus Pacearchaeota archaeon]|nr:hypothetical protein [Candidatus Pacearchaeota archaeon]